MSKDRFWMGDPPATCDITKEAVTDEFIDGATIMGPWACMTPASHKKFGRGLGTGRGQRYVKQADGRFKKVEG